MQLGLRQGARRQLADSILMHTSRPQPLLRRTFLSGVVAVAGGSVIGTGCGLLPEEAIEVSTAPLRLLYTAISQAQQTLAAVREGEHLTALRNNHQEHLAALRRRLGGAVPPDPEAPSASSTGDPSTQLIDAERELRTTARQRTLALPDLRDSLDGPPLIDQLSLLGSITACQATHLVLLDASTPEAKWLPPKGSRRSTATLQTVLANEHAVIYGYGALGGRLPTDQREQALGALERHRMRRDALGIAITTQGVTAVTSASSYELPRAIETPEQARELAIALEEGCAGHWRAALAGVESRDRSFALAALTDCATTATAWRQRNGSQPATVPFPGS